MNISCVPAGIADEDRPGQGISDIAKAGFQDVMLDISMYCKRKELEEIGKNKPKKNAGSRIKLSEHPEEMQQILKPMIDRCRAEHLEMTVAYAPCLSRGTKHTDLKELVIRLTEESIRTAEAAGCSYIVIRPYFAGVEHGEEWQVNREYYLHFAEILNDSSMMILLENQCKDVGGHLVRGICSDAVEAAEWVDTLNKECGGERFGFCMNVSACNLCGLNMYDFSLTLDKRLKAVILSENDGDKEDSLLPFTVAHQRGSETDWLSLMRGLRELEFDGQLILDIEDTASSFSPILRPQLMTLAKAVANYFKWQIEIEQLLKKYENIVLFGAGNMCRNYMKCYGQKYRPLFTCDNNKATWGTTFCGLEVKSPESLKDIPKDCTIFICNIYYREIEKQLRDMGIENPIEFFNDEYMPNFHFDRLEGR